MTDGLLRLCTGCGRYTLSAACPACQSPTRTPHPARYSPEDRWGAYRRALQAAATESGPKGGEAR